MDGGISTKKHRSFIMFPKIILSHNAQKKVFVLFFLEKVPKFDKNCRNIWNFWKFKCRYRSRMIQSTVHRPDQRFSHRKNTMLRLDEKKYKHHSILFSICGINFSNIFAAPSTEGLCLDKKKGKACFNFFFHLWDNFFNSFTAPSAEGLYLDGKKNTSMIQLFLPFVG